MTDHIADMTDEQDISASSGFMSWELDGAHAGTLLQFERILKGNGGFSLVFLQYNDPVYRDNLIPYLEQYAQSPGRLILEPDTPFHIFEEQLAALSTNHDLMQVLGLNQWLSGEEREARIRGLNYHRELIAEQAHTVVALWALEDEIRAIALDAPDMWAWRSAVLDFSVIREQVQEFVLDRIDLGSADIEEKRQRQQEIETFLAANPDATVSRATLLLELGQIKSQFGLWDDALLVLNEARVLYRRLGHKRDALFAQGEMARIQTFKGDVDEALALYEELLKIFKRLGDKRSWAVSLIDIAKIYASKGDVDKALKLSEEGLEVFKKLGDKHSCGGALSIIASIFMLKDDTDKALKLFYETLKIYDSLEDKRSRAVTMGSIARIYVKNGEVEKALELYNKTLEVYNYLGDKRSRAMALGDIAKIYVRKGDFKKAVALFEEKLKVAEQMGDEAGIAHACWSLALIDLQHKDFRKAFERLTQSYEIMVKLEQMDGICAIGMNYGPLLCRQGKLEDGLDVLRRSAEGYSKLGREDLVQVATNLIQVIKQQSTKR